VVSEFDVTHTLYDGKPCDRDAAELYRSENYTLCAEKFHEGRYLRMRRSTAASPKAPIGAARALLDDLLKCTPAPAWIERTRVHRWGRSERWNSAPVAVQCDAEFPRPTAVRRLRIALNLPKATETLVYRVRITMEDGASYKQQGVLEFRDNPNGEIPLPGGPIKRVNIRLVPSFLPYLNVRALDLRS
jgi:hypothetical protein